MPVQNLPRQLLGHVHWGLLSESKLQVPLLRQNRLALSHPGKEGTVRYAAH